MEILEEVEQLLEHILLLVAAAQVLLVIPLALDLVLVARVVLVNHSQDLNILLLEWEH